MDYTHFGHPLLSGMGGEDRRISRDVAAGILESRQGGSVREIAPLLPNTLSYYRRVVRLNSEW